MDIDIVDHRASGPGPAPPRRTVLRTYNVGSGRATTNAQAIEAIGKVVPEARVGLTAACGMRHAACSNWSLDVGRLKEDTCYQPEYDTERATAEASPGSARASKI
ncbi:hypothetical protein ACWCPT_19485 [Streptomyces sp. NPDC002308]